MTNDPRTLAHQPPAITKPGELWHVANYRPTSVIICRDDTDGYPLAYTVAEFKTVRDAACAVQAHNMVEEIVGLWNRKREMRAGVLLDETARVLEKYGRLSK